MNNINVMDCTLREFISYSNNISDTFLTNIYNYLCKTGVEYIDCGHLRNKNICSTRLMNDNLNSFDEIFKYNHASCVALIDVGRYDLTKLQDYNGGVISGIRICFKHDQMKLVPMIAQQIKNHGYKVFVQHVDYIGYSANEVNELIDLLNEVKPYCYSIVDTFGNMEISDYKNAVTFVNSHLSKDIMLGLHTHNNKMLANYFAMDLSSKVDQLDRDIMVDSTLMGVGRGSGNANTEIVCNFLKKYAIFLRIVAKCVKVPFHVQHFEGESLEYLV